MRMVRGCFEHLKYLLTRYAARLGPVLKHDRVLADARYGTSEYDSVDRAYAKRFRSPRCYSSADSMRSSRMKGLHGREQLRTD